MPTKWFAVFALCRTETVKPFASPFWLKVKKLMKLKPPELISSVPKT